MLWDTKTIIKFSIPFLLIVGVLTWRLGPETEEKFPAYHTTKSNNIKDSKIRKVIRSIKEKLSSLDTRISVKETKPLIKPRLNITNPAEGDKTYQGDVIIISWEAENIPKGETIQFNYKDSKGWSRAFTINPQDSSYSWKVPDGVTGFVLLNLGIYEGSSTKWIVGDRIHIKVETNKEAPTADKKSAFPKNAKIYCRIHNTDTLSVLAPENRAVFSAGDIVEIRWKESNLPTCTGVFPRKTYLHYKINEPRKRWYEIKSMSSVEAVNTYEWVIPEWVRERVILLQIGASCNTGKWKGVPVCRALFIE